MERKIYQLMVWQQDKLIYYNDFINKNPDYEALSNTHRIQNCYGVSQTVSNIVKQIHPDRTTQFKNFRTQQYQFNLYQTLNGVKIILLSSVRNEDDGIDGQMEKIFQAYIDHVKRNYLYEQGQIIKIQSFEDAVMEILFPKLKNND